MQIITTSPTEQHSSWLASNPVIGCPMNCAYCFLRPEGLNKTKPRVLFSPDEAITDLLESEFYTKDIPIATGTRTDYFATPANMEYLRSYVKVYNERVIANPLIIITKQEIPDDMIDFFVDTQKMGTRFVFFLSYSGLDSSIEKGIDHEVIRQNFITLSQAGLRVIHYWRPFVPQNSTDEAIRKVIDHVTKYADASVTTGLKLTPEMKEQFWFWKEIQETRINLAETEGVWPEGIDEKLTEIKKEFPQHYIGLASSCAIACSFGIPDYNGFWKTEVCSNSSCPETQRKVCGKKFKDYIITNEMVQKVFSRLDISQVGYEINNIDRVLIVHGSLPHSKIVNIAQSLKTQVRIDDNGSDSYGWGSSVSSQKKTVYL